MKSLGGKRSVWFWILVVPGLLVFAGLIPALVLQDYLQERNARSIAEGVVVEVEDRVVRGNRACTVQYVLPSNVTRRVSDRCTSDTEEGMGVPVYYNPSSSFATLSSPRQSAIEVGIVALMYAALLAAWPLKALMRKEPGTHRKALTNPTHRSTV